ncbi:hypothetical protein AAHB60_25660 [Pseudomonas aeruginosa]
MEISAGSSLSRFSYDPERKRYLQTVDGRTSVYLDEGRFEEVNDGGRSWQDAYVGDYLILRKEGAPSKALPAARCARLGGNPARRQRCRQRTPVFRRVRRTPWR